MRRALLLSILAVLLLASTTLSASKAPSAMEVQRYVIAGGGGHSELGSYTLDGTVGQAVVGTVGPVDHQELCSGFWCGMGRYRHMRYLPLILFE